MKTQVPGTLVEQAETMQNSTCNTIEVLYKDHRNNDELVVLMDAFQDFAGAPRRLNIAQWILNAEGIHEIRWRVNNGHNVKDAENYGALYQSAWFDLDGGLYDGPENERERM